MDRREFANALRAIDRARATLDAAKAKAKEASQAFQAQLKALYEATGGAVVDDGVATTIVAPMGGHYVLRRRLKGQPSAKALARAAEKAQKRAEREAKAKARAEAKALEDAARAERRALREATRQAPKAKREPRPVVVLQ